jgi:hypothetical protein
VILPAAQLPVWGEPTVAVRPGLPGLVVVSGLSGPEVLVDPLGLVDDGYE